MGTFGWLIIIAGIVTFSVVVISNLLNQIAILEVEVKTIDDVENRAHKFYIFILGIFTTAYDDMERVDKRGAFSADDEVGFAFRTIMESIQQVKFQLEAMKVDNEENTKEENTKEGVTKE
tara:strand:- start:692 stop:1051 length:360 start_codon:yes stop_codon:yes gene_type:complete